MHTFTHTHMNTHKAPWGVVSAQMPPLPSSLLLSLILSLSLDSFSDMPAQAHLAAHALPLHFPYLPPPFTFLPCGISMATWKETSVLGEQCDGVGCFGWGAVFRVEGAADKKGRKGSRGIQYCPPREARASLAWQQRQPPS